MCVIAPDALFALADVLDAEGTEVASPAFAVDTSDASWAVRQHYRIWELTDYRQQRTHRLRRVRPERGRACEVRRVARCDRR